MASLLFFPGPNWCVRFVLFLLLCFRKRNITLKLPKKYFLNSFSTPALNHSNDIYFLHVRVGSLDRTISPDIQSMPRQTALNMLPFSFKSCLTGLFWMNGSSEHLRILKDRSLYLFCQCVSVNCFKLHQTLSNIVSVWQWHLTINTFVVMSSYHRSLHLFYRHCNTK